MNKSLIAIALATSALCAQAQSQIVIDGTGFKGPIAYPGNMWGTTVLAPNAPDGYPRYRIEGVIEQGADWFRFGDDKWKFNTYVAGEYVINSDSRGFSPVIGMKMSRSYTDGNLDLGVRYKYGSTYLSPTGSGTGGTESIGRVEIFATYWFGWNLKR